MDRDQLVMGIAAVFAGMTVVLVVLGFAYQLFLLFVAVPFGLTTGFMWYQATGRLEARMRNRAVGAGRTAGPDAGVGPDAGFRSDKRFGTEAGAGPGSASRTGGARSRFGPRGARGRRRRATTPPNRQGPSPEEAYRTLGLDPGATDEEVRRAYREKVKQVHPDTDAGDEEAFKRVNRAYERLTD